MPLPILVKITDGYGQTVRGSSGLYGEEDAIIGYSYDHQLERIFDDTDEDEEVNIHHEPISFVKEVDNTSPILNQMLAFGDELQKVEFTFYIHDGTRESIKYYTTVIEKAQIVKVSPFSKMTFLKKNEPYRLMERVEFTYKTILWTHYNNENSSIIMAMDDVQNVPEDKPQTQEDYLFRKNLARERKDHPGIDDATLQGIARQNTADDMLWEKDKNKHWVEMKYLYPDDSGVDSIPYRVKLPGGKEETGVFTKDTVLRFENLPAGAAIAEFGEPVEEKLFKSRKKIKATLDEIVLAKQEETGKNLEEHEKQAPAGEDGSSEKPKGKVEISDSFRNMASLFNPNIQTGGSLKSAYTALQNGEASNDSWAQPFTSGAKANIDEEYISDPDFEPTEIDSQQVAEAYELAAYITDDGPTDSMFKSFSKDYVKAHNGFDVAKMKNSAASEISIGVVLAALNGGTTGKSQFGEKTQSLIKERSPQFKELFTLLKKKNLNTRFKAGTDKQHIKKVAFPNSPEVASKDMPWTGIVLKDEEGNILKNEKYVINKGEQVVSEGTTNSLGMAAKVVLLENASYEVSFPDIYKEEV